MIDITISTLLRSYRVSRGLSQTTVAEELGISRNYVSMIERGIASNLSYSLAQRILNLGGTYHGQVQVVLTRKVWVDSAIAAEIVWLNSQGVTTRGCCQGPPPTSMILPSSATRACELGYECTYEDDVYLVEIALKSEVNR